MTDPAPPTRRAFSVAVYARKGGRGGRVLVILHSRTGLWLPIGGELEAGETPLEAAVRELREETGWSGRTARWSATARACRPDTSATRSTSPA